MSVVKNDLTREQIRKVTEGMGEIARQKAFQAGTTITYVVDGNIVQESSDGTIMVVGPTTAGTVDVKKKNWKLG